MQLNFKLSKFHNRAIENVHFSMERTHRIVKVFSLILNKKGSNIAFHDECIIIFSMVQSKIEKSYQNITELN